MSTDQESQGHCNILLLTQKLLWLQEYECIGDVRGSGLMLGIEIVQSKASKAPAPAAAAYIKEAMLGLRVLMTVDGPNANVLKIKPPMVFAEPDADRMLAVLAKVCRRKPCSRCILLAVSQAVSLVQQAFSLPASRHRLQAHTDKAWKRPAQE